MIQKVINSTIVLMLIMASAVFVGCSSDNDGGSDDEVKPSDQVVEIGTFPHPGTGTLLKVEDITANYERVYYENGVIGQQRAVLVDHVSFDHIPDGLKETVKMWGMSAPTKVFRCEWEGRTVYHFLAGIYDPLYGIYEESGERIAMTPDGYEWFIKDSREVKCVLVMTVERVKNANGANNPFVGIWQNDIDHLHYYQDEKWTEVVGPIYQEVPIGVTSVKSFSADGTGFLRTVIQTRDGIQMMSVDRFRYRIDDYYPVNNAAMFTYTCYFDAGDTIQYTTRMRWGLGVAAFDHLAYDYPIYSITNPWRYQDSDTFENSGFLVEPPVYGTPQRLEYYNIVGKWIGYDYGASKEPEHKWTLVFRQDGTGYLLLDQVHQKSFVYTADIWGITNYMGYNEGEEFAARIYKFDTGYEKDYDREGEILRGNIYGGVRMRVNGFYSRDAVGQQNPITFYRQ